MAIIAAYRIEEKMVSWVATYRGMEDDLTHQAFMSKLNELTEDRSDNTDKDYDQY